MTLCKFVSCFPWRRLASAKQRGVGCMLQEQDANHLATDGTLYLFFGSYDRTADVMERIEQIIIVAAHACKLPIKCDSCPH